MHRHKYKNKYNHIYDYNNRSFHGSSAARRRARSSALMPPLYIYIYVYQCNPRPGPRARGHEAQQRSCLLLLQAARPWSLRGTEVQGFTVQSVLGKGSFGIVYKVVRAADKQTCAPRRDPASPGEKRVSTAPVATQPPRRSTVTRTRAGMLSR